MPSALKAKPQTHDVRQRALVAQMQARIVELETALAARPARKTTARPRKTAARAIVMGGRTFPAQRAWYGEAMRVKRGVLVWDPGTNAERFGSRGGYVTPEKYAENEAHRVSLAASPMSDVERRVLAEAA
jgi:hypothetical protein